MNRRGFFKGLLGAVMLSVAQRVVPAALAAPSVNSYLYVVRIGLPPVLSCGNGALHLVSASEP